MRRPATPLRAEAPARRAPPSSTIGSRRLSPHTPLDTHKHTQLIRYKTGTLVIARSEATKQSILSLRVEMDCFASLAMTGSISVLVFRHQRQRRLEQDEQVEQHRPVLDVIEIELDPLLDLLVGVDLAAPAVDLGPAGDPWLDAVAREVAVDGLVEQPALQFALHGVRPGADQRQVALEHDVEQLRQFVEARLADEAADASD